MPTITAGIVSGLIGGLIGGVVLAIINMMMQDKMKVTAPGILAKKMFGDENKKPLLMLMVLGIWGLIFGILVAVGTVPETLTGALTIAAVAWLVLNIMMLPMAGAGVFGLKASKMIPVQSLVMHAIYGVVLFYAFGFIGTLF